MTEIIPSINVSTFAQVQERINQVEPYVTWCHLDVTDGIFSSHATWRNPADLALLNTSLKIEVHLMIEKPELSIDQWLVKPIKRIIVHQEATDYMDSIIEKCRQAGIECGIAIRPDTSWDVLAVWKAKVHVMQVLAVNPGPSGQQMSSDIVDKIGHLRASCSSCMIEVDGGINPVTALQVRNAGANILVSGGYLFSQSDMGDAIKELQGN